MYSTKSYTINIDHMYISILINNNVSNAPTSKAEAICILRYPFIIIIIFYTLGFVLGFLGLYRSLIMISIICNDIEKKC